MYDKVNYHKTQKDAIEGREKVGLFRALGRTFIDVFHDYIYLISNGYGMEWYVKSIPYRVVVNTAQARVK